jgi:hypothetical protein
MKADDVGARLGKIRDDPVHRLDHQVHVDRHFRAVGRARVRTDRLAHHRPDGEIGNVVIVHHVEVDHVGAGGDHRTHFFAKSREISRKNGRCNSIFHDAGFYAKLRGRLVRRAGGGAAGVFSVPA